MKFANLCDHASTSINMGDYLQFSVISGLYERMGIPESQIYYLRGEELSTYRGELLLLPLNFVATIFIHEDRLAISSDIVPVFLALSLSNMKEKLNIERFFSQPENVAFFLRYGPVGCRDEYTYRIFLDYGIPAYLNGCLTATISRRQMLDTQNKVFFADAPAGLLPYIPKELFLNCEFVSQQAHFSQTELLDYHSVFQFVKKRYVQYEREAKLIVTSRLHVAVPCSAMGIPVIFAKDYIDTRFSWLEKLIPLYELEQYPNINWNPLVPEYEEQKEKMILLAISRIQSTYELYSKAKAIGEYYLSRNALKHYYDSHDITHKNTKYLQQYAENNWNEKQHIKFGLWGISENAMFWVQWICEKYPLAEFVMAIDSYKKGTFDGMTICTPDVLKKETSCCIIVISVSAVPDAKRLFERLEWGPSHYCIAVDSFIMEKPDCESKKEGEEKI